MTPAVSIKEIEELLLKGVKKAFRTYSNYTGGWGLGFAPESFIQFSIAQTVAKKIPYVTFEDTVDSILFNADAERRGPKPRSSSKGRVDLILWWAKDKPRVLVEVKKTWGVTGINEDADRLRKLQNRGGTFQSCYVVAYTDAIKKETVIAKLDKIAESSKTKIVGRISPLIVDDEEYVKWYWGAACFKV